MSIATDQLQPPPMAVLPQQATPSRGSDDGSVGPVVSVLAVITILGSIAGMIGRLFSSRRLGGSGQYDIEGWIEKKCSSCLDGRVDVPPPGPPPQTAAADGVPVAMPILPEMKGPNLQAVGGA